MSNVKMTGNTIPRVVTEDPYFEQEWRKMLSGQLYDASYKPFLDLLTETRKRIKRFNDMEPDDTEGMRAILRGLLGTTGERFIINQPFHCDYGCNIHLGEDFMANFNLTILDEAPVRFGRNVFIGPNVTIATACHPLDADARRGGDEWAEPVTIGNDVWIGSCVTICPGVTIGDGAVIGAGATVTRDIPGGMLALGVPARPVRPAAPTR